MNRRIFLTELIFLLALLSPFAKSQTLLTTQPLGVTSTCPNSTISVPFTFPIANYTTNTVFTVQLSDGGEFTDIPTGKTLMATGKTVDERKISATIPANLTPGVAYSVRIVSTNPDYTGTPSTTKLVVKGKESKPPVPLVDSLILTCMSFGTSSDDMHYADIRIKIDSEATARLYYDNKRDQFSEYAQFPYVIKQANGDYVKDKQSGYFQINKYGFSSPTYVYPVNERTFYISQRIDGCESEQVATKVRIIWKAGGGPEPTNPQPNNPHFGRLAYCQGEQTYPLNVNGHAAAPENFQVTYAVGGFQSFNPTSLIPPVPDTRTVGNTSYVLNLVPIDASKGCSNQNYLTFTYLTVTVNPPPTKPTATTGLIEFLQGQPSTPLSASTTDDAATLVWYGTNATGGVGSTTAPQPATNQSGQFTYYVAQRIGSCESERTGISVLINPLLVLNDDWLEAHSDAFPNPAISRLTVQVGGVSTQQPALLELLDLAGKSLEKHSIQEGTSVLNLDTYLGGSYFLLIRVGNRQTIKRIVKL